ncbi:MAG: shikimate dehydrogenase [Rikenellaceae bacterium]
MRKFGLIGEHLPHSFSGRYFASKFEREGITDCSYSLYELPHIEALEEQGLIAPLAEGGLEGFNITIPYKRDVMRYLDRLSPEADSIGAVNCVKREGESLVGYNTDIIGLYNSMIDFLGEVRTSKALILGTGGAASAVEYVMRQLGIEYSVVSRSKGENRITYGELTPEVIAENLLIINATPLGTFPNVDSSPAIPYEAITPSHYLFDLVYNPPLTQFLERGRDQGASICNGEAMLIGQAEAAWKIWNE